MSNGKSVNLIDWVQEHERAWGSTSYAARPTLSAVLAAPVVVFWSHAPETKAKHYTISLHNDLSEMEKYFARLLFVALDHAPKRHVAAIFAEGRRVRVSGVQIAFTPVE